MTHHLTNAEDFARLARCCRHMTFVPSGRITLGVPGLDGELQRTLETRINRFWASCGCGEGAAAALLALLAWWAGVVPLRSAFTDSSMGVSTLVALAWAFAVSTIVKFGGVWWAHWRLAGLLTAQADQLREAAASFAEGPDVHPWPRRDHGRRSAARPSDA